jgi:hypothetical protein
MKYEYRVLYPADAYGRFLKRPLIEIDITGPRGKMKELALIDSGADRSLFHQEIAEMLGIDLSTAQYRRTIGITGAMDVAYTEVQITLEQTGASIKIPVGFIDSPYVSVLLGQEGFFDQHTILFERGQNSFSITPLTHPGAA